MEPATTHGPGPSSSTSTSLSPRSLLCAGHWAQQDHLGRSVIVEIQDHALGSAVGGGKKRGKTVTLRGRREKGLLTSLRARAALDGERVEVGAGEATVAVGISVLAKPATLGLLQSPQFHRCLCSLFEVMGLCVWIRL